MRLIKTFLPSTARLFFVAMALITAEATTGSAVFAQAGGEFEGAVWRFSMTPKAKTDEPMRGLFRVADSEIFIKEKAKDKKFSKHVGKAVFNSKTSATKIVFEEMRVFHRGEEKGKEAREFDPISGTASVKMDEKGEWSGRFTDSAGHNWEFRCTRVKE